MHTTKYQVDNRKTNFIITIQTMTTFSLSSSPAPSPKHKGTSVHTHSRTNPGHPFGNNNIPELKKEMEAAMRKQHSKPSSSSSSASYAKDKYGSQVSLMKSDVSLLSDVGLMARERGDLFLMLLDTEEGVTEEILGLTEDKLTIKEEYNKIVEDRMRLERQLQRLKRVSQKSSEIDQLTVFENQNSNSRNSIKNGQPRTHTNIHLGYPNPDPTPQLTPEPTPSLSPALSPLQLQLQQLQSQLQNLQHTNKILSQKLSKPVEDNTRKQQGERFESFSPSKQSQLTNLHYRRSQLYSQMGKMLPVYEGTILEELIAENDQLFDADRRRRIAKGQGGSSAEIRMGVEEMRVKIQEEEDAKHRFFADLGKFKEEANHFRQENEKMRRMLAQSQ